MLNVRNQFIIRQKQDRDTKCKNKKKKRQEFLNERITNVKYRDDTFVSIKRYQRLELKNSNFFPTEDQDPLKWITIGGNFFRKADRNGKWRSLE